MELHKLTCPSCNGSLDIKIDDRNYIHCPYCGQMFSFDDGKREYTINQNINITKNITHTQRKIDDAEIIRAKTEAKEKKNKMWSSISPLIVLIICLGILVFGALEEEKDTKEALKAGKMSAGSSSEYVDTDYEAVVEQLKLLGFTNVTSVDLKDAGLALWKNGKVVSVSIDGDTSFGSNDYFYPDAVVIVTHH